MNLKNRLLTAGSVCAGLAVMLFAPDVLAANGDPLSEAGANFIGIGTGLGGIVCAGGGLGACAAIASRAGGPVVAALGLTTLGGAGMIGSPQLVEQVIGVGAGFSLANLAAAPAALDVMQMLSTAAIYIGI